MKTGYAISTVLRKLRLARVLNYGHRGDDPEYNAWVETRWHFLARLAARSWAQEATGQRHWVVRTKRDHPARIRVWLVR